MLIKHQSILYAIHFVNSIWIARIFWLGWVGRDGEVNFLADRLLILLLILCFALHFVRWRLLAAERLDAQYSSGIALRQEMERTARAMFGRVPYLISPIPSQTLLQRKADSLVASGAGFKPSSKRNLMLAVLNVDGLISAHFFVLFLSPFGLYASDFERFANLFRAFWPLQSLFAIVAAGLLIYSATTILFSVTFNRERN